MANKVILFISLLTISQLCNAQIGNERDPNENQIAKSVIKTWKYAAIYRLSSDGSNKLVKKITGAPTPEKLKLFSASDYSLFNKMDQTSGNLFYLYILFEDDQIKQENSKILSSTFSDRFLVIGWNDYQDCKFRLKSLSKDNMSGDHTYTLKEILELSK